MAMLAGNVAEMATGEGKTLAAAIAAYGHVRLGHGPVHVITVNDYLARRDAEWMGPVYELLGLTRRLGDRGVHRRASAARRTAATSPTSRSTRPASTTCATSWSPTSTTGCSRALATAIVDEADSILIDEARVPMVLAGSGRRASRTRCTPPTRWCAAWSPGATTRSPTTAAASR